MRGSITSPSNLSKTVPVKQIATKKKKYAVLLTQEKVFTLSFKPKPPMIYLPKLKNLLIALDFATDTYLLAGIIIRNFLLPPKN